MALGLGSRISHGQEGAVSPRSAHSSPKYVGMAALPTVCVSDKCTSGLVLLHYEQESVIQGSLRILQAAKE